MSQTYLDTGLQALLAGGGNIAGGVFNTYMNSLLQEQQFENQKELQDRAYHYNQWAVQRQAQNQAQGMQNAGLNPAAVNGAGAPSIQAGAAAGSTSTFGNIFQGIAELITAVKAPTEIEKMIAETGLTKAETGLSEAQTAKTEVETSGLLPEQIENLKNSSLKLVEETQNLKNINDVFEATDNQIRESMQNEYKAMMDKAIADGTWNDYAPKTRETIQKLAEGDKSMGIGELRGMMETVASMKNISDTDRLLKQNQLYNRIANIQLQDKNVQRALANMPKAEYNELVARKNKLIAELPKIAAETNEAKRHTMLMKYNEEQGKANDEMWQRIYGDKEIGKEIRDQHIRDKIIQGGIDAAKGIAQGGAIGASGTIINKMLNGEKPKFEPTNPGEGQFYTGGLKGWQESGKSINKNSPWQ